MSDIVIIGGGVIGLSAAYELAVQGVSVCVLEQGQFGREASWAGAGMLPPGNPQWAATPEARLRAASHGLWPAWTDQLRQQTGIETGYVKCGSLRLAFADDGDELASELAAWQAERVALEALTATQLHERFPWVNPTAASGFFLPELCQVRNPWLLRSLQTACAQRGVELYHGHPVQSLEHNGNRVHTVRTPSGEFAAGQFVIASGAWSRGLARQVGLEVPIEPVRGQMVLVETRSRLFDCVIEHGSQYLVPRRDGRLLIGSTEEHVGFDKGNTAAGVTQLLALAQRLVPSLADARFERAWAGLRPHRPGGLPFIGRSPQFENVVLAAGHYRAGLQLSPITAVLIRELILGQPLSIVLDGLNGASPR